MPRAFLFMSKDPAVLFYTSDFLSGTFTMSNEQVGKYIRLLCLQHQKGRLTEKDMLSICLAYDVDIWDKFVIEEGFFYNIKMRDESQRRAKYTESRRSNSKSLKTESISEAYAKHMDNHMETATETITKTNINISREKFNNDLIALKIQLGDEYENFLMYWTEPNKNGKLRYEVEKFFNLERRILTWNKNKDKYATTKSATAASTKRMSDLKQWVGE